MATVFISYTHVDEALRDKLEIALATMKRQGLIEAWHDRRIKVGDEFDHTVRAELERADVILLLVSPDFIASDYCYDVEVKRAMERHNSGDARVIPIILRACDWHPAPFGKLLAAPKDGKPIGSWPNLDEAFYDVAQRIRAALPAPAATQSHPAPKESLQSRISSGPRSSNLRLKKTFSDVDRDRFLDEAFEYMARFFEGSLAELQARNPGVEGAFKRVDATHFTAAVYQNGTAISRCRIFLGSSMGRGICYSVNDRDSDNGFNECLSVQSDDQSLFLQSFGMMNMKSDGESNLTFEGASEHYWSALIGRLQGR